MSQLEDVAQGLGEPIAARGARGAPGDGPRAEVRSRGDAAPSSGSRRATPAEAARRPPRAVAQRGPAMSQIEEVAQGLGEPIASRGARGVLEADGGLVQQ